MDFLQVLVLALVQGVSEFLPISSSAHLILTSQLLGWDDQGAAFDVAVHVGTLLAVMGYFRRDIAALLAAWWRSVHGQHSAEGRLAWAVVIGTLPMIPAAILLMEVFGGMPRAPLLIAITTVVFALLLWWADRMTHAQTQLHTDTKSPASVPHGSVPNGSEPDSGVSGNSEKNINLKQGLLIGCAQAVALLPGTSRSGATMTAALALGFSRTTAARFSFLLAIPAILMGGTASLLDVFEEPSIASGWDMLLGAVIAGVFAALTIHWFLKLIEKIGMLPFVLYRLALGALLLVMIFTGALPSGF